MTESAIWRARRKLARTPLAPLLILPARARMALSSSLGSTARSMSWLITSKEHTNFSYDLTDLNKEQLAWFVAQISGNKVSQVRSFIAELDEDEEFRQQLIENARQSPRRYLMDFKVLYGRRLGWYALVRALKPRTLVETGTDRGLGTSVLAQAMQENGVGQVFTIDINPDAGFLFRETDLESRITRLTGSSLELIKSLPEQIDFFLHDSDHAAAYETAELAAVTAKLSPEAVVLSDNSQATAVLSQWAEKTGRSFAYFQEVPKDHWWPGDGIGVAWNPSSTKPSDP